MGTYLDSLDPRIKETAKIENMQAVTRNYLTDAQQAVADARRKDFEAYIRSLVGSPQQSGATSNHVPQIQSTPIQSTPITPDSLSPVQPTPFKTYTPSTPPAIDWGQYITPSPAETARDNDYLAGRNTYQNLLQQLSGEGDDRSRLMTEQDIGGKSQVVQDLTGQMRQLQAESQAAPLQAISEGQGRMSVGMIDLKTQEAQRNIAVRALTTGAQLQAAQGNLSLAMDMVDKSIKAKYDPIREQIALQRDNLDLILRDPRATRAEKERAEMRGLMLEERKAAMDRMEQTESDIQGLAVEAASLGATSDVIRALGRARTVEEAAAIWADAGLGQPAIETDVVKLDNGQTVVINRSTGEVIQNLGGAASPTQQTVAVTPEGVPISGEAQNWIDLVESGTMSIEDALTKIGSSKDRAALRDQVVAGLNTRGGYTEKKVEQFSTILTLIDEIENGDFEYFGASIAPRDSLLGKAVGGNPYFNAFNQKVTQLENILSIENLPLLKGPLSDRDIEFVKALGGAPNIKVSEAEARNRLNKIKKFFQEKLKEAGIETEATTDIESFRTKYGY